jgi:hypothetical protein
MTVFPCITSHGCLHQKGDGERCHRELPIILNRYSTGHTRPGRCCALAAAPAPAGVIRTEDARDAADRSGTAISVQKAMTGSIYNPDRNPYRTWGSSLWIRAGHRWSRLGRIESRTCSSGASVVTAAIWANSLVTAARLSVHVRATSAHAPADGHSVCHSRRSARSTTAGHSRSACRPCRVLPGSVARPGRDVHGLSASGGIVAPVLDGLPTTAAPGGGPPVRDPVRRSGSHFPVWRPPRVRRVRRRWRRRDADLRASSG